MRTQDVTGSLILFDVIVSAAVVIATVFGDENDNVRKKLRNYATFYYIVYIVFPQTRTTATMIQFLFIEALV